MVRHPLHRPRPGFRTCRPHVPPDERFAVPPFSRAPIEDRFARLVRPAVFDRSTPDNAVSPHGTAFAPPMRSRRTDFVDDLTDGLAGDLVDGLADGSVGDLADDRADGLAGDLTDDRAGDGVPPHEGAFAPPARSALAGDPAGSGVPPHGAAFAPPTRSRRRAVPALPFDNGVFVVPQRNQPSGADHG